MKNCKFCYNKGFNILMVGADVAMPDKKHIVKPQRIRKIPCKKCEKWRELKGA